MTTQLTLFDISEEENIRALAEVVTEKLVAKLVKQQGYSLVFQRDETSFICHTEKPISRNKNGSSRIKDLNNIPYWDAREYVKKELAKRGLSIVEEMDRHKFNISIRFELNPYSGCSHDGGGADINVRVELRPEELYVSNKKKFMAAVKKET